MAKKKKLNKRAVAVLVVVGAVVVLGVAVATTQYWLPRDPAPFAARAKKAFEANDFEKARGLYQTAIRYDQSKNATYLYELARTEQEILRTAKLTQTDRIEKTRTVMDLLQKATRFAPRYPEPHRSLCEMYWQFQRFGDYVSEANQLLDIEPGDANILYRRAIAKARVCLVEDPPDPDRVDDAIADFTRAQDLKPDELGYWMGLISFLSDPRVKRDANVPAVFERAVKMDPGSVALRAQYAEYLRTHGRKDEALQQIEEAVRRKPDDPEGYLARAEYFENENDLIEARKALDKAKKIDDSDYRIYRRLALLLFRQQRHEEALQSMRTGIATVSSRLAKDSNEAEVRRLKEASWQMNYQLARLILERYLTQQDQSPAAREEVQKCMDAMAKISPDHRGASMVAGMLAYAQGDMRKAVNLLQQSVQESGTVDSQTAGVLSMALVRLREPSRAQEVLEEISRRGGTQMSPSLTLLAADLKLMARDYAGADVEIAKVLQASPGNGQALSLKCVLDILTGAHSPLLPDKIDLSATHIDMLVDRALQLMSEGRGPDALTLLQGLHKKDPANRTVLSRLLDIYLARGMTDRAEDLRKEAQAADPKLAAWIGDGIDIRSEKDPQKRFEILKARVERDPDLKGAMKELAISRIAEQCGPTLAKEAEDHLQAAIKLDPNGPSVVDLAFVRSVARKDWKAAEEWASRAASTNADGMGGHWYAARLAMIREQWLRAIEDLNEVYRLRPESKLVRVLLGDCHLGMGDLDKAQSYYQAVLKLEGTYYTAVRGMAILTARQNKPTEHDYWVGIAAKLPPARDDEYIRQENLKRLDRLGDPKTLSLRIEQRVRAFQREPENLDNAYQLGTLFERAQRAAEGSRDANEAERMSKYAESMYRAVYEKSPAPSKLAGAKPLADYYGRNKKKSELLTLLEELGNLPDVDKLDRQILAGDSLSYVDPATAELAYKQALNVAPSDARGYKALGRFYERQGRWADAIATYKKYREVAPTDKDPLLLLASAQVQGGDPDEAAKALSGILSADPANTDALALQGLLAMRQRRYDDAAKAFDAALQGGVINIRALLGRSQLQLILGHADKAKQDLQTIRQAVNDPVASVEYAKVCRYLGDVQSAELAYMDALSRQADYGPAMSGMVELYLQERNWVKLEKQLADARRAFPADPAYRLIEAQMWKTRGDPQKSLEALQAASTMAPDSYPVLYEYLTRLLAEKQYDKVIALSNEYAAKPATHILALAAKGRALVRSQKVPEGEAAFQAALKDKNTLPQAILLSQQVQQAYASPKAACDAASRWVREGNLADPYTKVFLGDVYSGAKDYASAIRYLGEARAAAVSNSDKALTGFMLGLAYYQNKDYPHAIQAYEDVLKINPDDLSALNNLAYLFANDLQDPQRALPHAKRAMELAMGNANVVDTYGWVQVQLKKYPEAVETLRRAVAIDGSNPILRYHLGYAFEQDNRLEDALKNYEAGLKSSPEGETRSGLQQGADRVRGKLKPE